MPSMPALLPRGVRGHENGQMSARSPNFGPARLGLRLCQPDLSSCPSSLDHIHARLQPGPLCRSRCRSERPRRRRLHWRSLVRSVSPPLPPRPRLISPSLHKAVLLRRRRPSSRKHQLAPLASRPRSPKTALLLQRPPSLSRNAPPSPLLPLPLLLQRGHRHQQRLGPRHRRRRRRRAPAPPPLRRPSKPRASPACRESSSQFGTRLKVSAGARHLPSLMSASLHLFQDPPPFRLSPSAPSDATPHQPPHAYIDPGRDPCRARAQGISLSGRLHHAANAPQVIAGREPSPSAYDSTPSTTCTPALLQTRSPTDSRTSPSIDVLPPSMPPALPSLTCPRKESASVGRIIADLFPDKVVVNVAKNTARPEPQVQAEIRSAQTPRIVETQPATPPPGPAWLHRGNSPPSHSAATSTTSTPRQVFPTVVIVNPTPHPTPPATPLPGPSEHPFGRDCPDRHPESWQGSPNVQLATPVSMNGCARSPEEPAAAQPVRVFRRTRDAGILIPEN